MRWECLWLIPPLVGLARALLLCRDSRRTCRAVRHAPPLAARIVRLMDGNLRRDRLRACVWFCFLLVLLVPPLLADVVPPEVRRELRNAFVIAGGVCLWLSGESDAADRRRLYEHHRPAGEREARRR